MSTIAPPEPAIDLGSRLVRTPQPAAIVIFGATGDLTHRKLMPGLYSLAAQQLLPPEAAIVGVARSELDDDGFRERMRDGVRRHGRAPVDEDVWAGFARRLHYLPGGFDDAAVYDRLRELLAGLDADRGTRGNRLFYLATAPEFFPVIAERLGGAGLAEETDGGERFARLVIEKPFGEDLRSARALNARLGQVFRERQVYRIDHYLGKETVQNLLVLRFGNAIFEPVWNRRYVDHVQITVAEDLGVGTRGGYYDQSGALRDIVQNHMLQVLSIVAMEPPARFESREVRDEKVKVLRSMRPMERSLVQENVVRGQYARGFVKGEEVPAYREEPDVAKDSRVDTFVAMRVHVDNWRWGGVPFYVRAGKRMARRVTEIAIQFKKVPHTLFRTPDGGISPNVLAVRVQPDEGIALRFTTKEPGNATILRGVAMDFRYGTAFGSNTPEAYERLLLDAMRGDATLFTRRDEVEEQWAYMDHVFDAWREQANVPPPSYAAGTWGPEQSDDLLARDGRRWRRP